MSPILLAVYSMRVRGKFVQEVSRLSLQLICGFMPHILQFLSIDIPVKEIGLTGDEFFSSALILKYVSRHIFLKLVLSLSVPSTNITPSNILLPYHVALVSPL